MNIERSLFEFLKLHFDPSRPVLLAFSGGADSSALFYLLLRYAQENALRFGVAHVDHGWRPESSTEATAIKELVTGLGIPFHSKILVPDQIKGNIEEACRLERLNFFSQLCHEHHYQAVILGHHADDQSETVLKRVFEGSSLPYLNGMLSECTIKGMKIWRPLLSHFKNEIILWLKQHHINWLEDSTNLNPKFLRGRFRTNLIPHLSKEFGKEIAPTLNRIGQESMELKKYLDGQLQSHISQIHQGPLGSYIDLSITTPATDFEIKYLIRQVCERQGIRISYPLINEACQKIQLKVSDCQLITKDAHLRIDRGRFFVMPKDLPLWEHNLQIIPGKQNVGNWTVIIEELDKGGLCKNLTGWQALWRGTLQVQLPPGNYRIAKADQTQSKVWTNAKVPAFLRWVAPVIWSNGVIIHEFLTSRNDIKNSSVYNPGLCVTMMVN